MKWTHTLRMWRGWNWAVLFLPALIGCGPTRSSRLSPPRRRRPDRFRSGRTLATLLFDLTDNENVTDEQLRQPLYRQWRDRVRLEHGLHGRYRSQPLHAPRGRRATQADHRPGGHEHRLPMARRLLHHARRSFRTWGHRGPRRLQHRGPGGHERRAAPVERELPGHPHRLFARQRHRLPAHPLPPD